MISNDVKKIIGILLSAINDWPNPILHLEDYGLDVKIFVGREVTKKSVYSALSKIDFSRESWQAESLSQLSEVFELYSEGISLTVIISDLSAKLEYKDKQF